MNHEPFNILENFGKGQAGRTAPRRSGCSSVVGMNGHQGGSRLTDHDVRTDSIFTRVMLGL